MTYLILSTCKKLVNSIYILCGTCNMNFLVSSIFYSFSQLYSIKINEMIFLRLLIATVPKNVKKPKEKNTKKCKFYVKNSNLTDTHLTVPKHTPCIWIELNGGRCGR